MRPQGGRLSGAERRAVAEYPQRPRARRRHHRREHRPLHDRPRRWLIRPSSPAWRGWSPSITNTRFQSAQQAGLTRGAGAAADAEMGVRISRRHLRLVAADGRRRPRCSSAARTAPSTRSTRRAAASIWTFTAKSGVRNALSFGAVATATVTRFTSATPAPTSTRSTPATGSELWTRRLDEHPFARITGSPTLVSATGSTCRSRRSRRPPPASPATNAARSAAAWTRSTPSTGAIVWKTYMVPRRSRSGRTPPASTLWAPSGVGVWSAPTIDAKRDVVYVAHRQHLQRHGASRPPTRSSRSIRRAARSSGRSS